MSTKLPVKPTLRLPKTRFHHRPIPSDQGHYLQRCTDELYQWQSTRRADQKPFILHDGPPYANGKLHIGHALNKILKDLICRVKVQQGRRVVFRPGWDCHGLPIEIKALKELKSLHKYKKRTGAEDEEFQADEFETRYHARELAIKTVREQKEEFRKWGIMADWDNPWTTMDKQYGLKQLSVFKNMVKLGLIFRRFKPVYWSPSSKTALAEAELDKEERQDIAAYAKFPLVTIPDALNKKVPGLRKLSVVIWTTMPWTLPANRAIAIRRNLEYTIVRFGKDDLVVATDRLSHLTNTIFKDRPTYIISNSILGSDLENAEYVNPIHGLDSQPRPVIHADMVSADSGTGLVHFAPGHGMEDYKVCSELGIEAFAPVDDLGCFTMEALPRDPWFLKGTFVLGHGSAKVLELMKDHVLLAHKHRKQWLYDWRTKGPTIERATAQWFADVEIIKGDALQRLNDVQFIPQTGRHRLESFVKSRSEWCISRQRPWGVPLPALYDEDGNAVLTQASVGHIISKMNTMSSDSWWVVDPASPDWKAQGLKGSFTRGKDTLDVWFDSGTSWTQMEGGIEGGQQADVYVEGTDQHRGWFQSSLLTHTASSPSKSAPFKTLITHGFTLDERGRKMSKSEGNVIAPDEIMEGTRLPSLREKKKGPEGKEKGQHFQAALGPDALRLWVASSDYTKDVVIGQPVLISNNAALLKYRVTLKLLLGAMCPEARTAPLTKLDQMALIQLQNVMQEVATAYNNYEFYKAIHAINRWINNDISALYLEAMKDRLYCGDGGGILEEIFNGLLRMLSPITPMLVEEAWSYRPEWMKAESRDVLSLDEKMLQHPFCCSLDDSVVRPEREDMLPDGLASLTTIEQEMPWIMNANVAVKTALEEGRKRKVIRSSLESSAIITVPDEARSLFEKYADELADFFVVSDLQLGEEPEERQRFKFSAEFEAPGGKGTVWILPPKGLKCVRCWKYLEVSEDDLCERCEGAVAEYHASHGSQPQDSVVNALQGADAVGS